MCGGHHHPFGLMREGKVVKLFDALDWFGEWDEKGLPMIRWDKKRNKVIRRHTQMCLPFLCSCLKRGYVNPLCHAVWSLSFVHFVRSKGGLDWGSRFPVSNLRNAHVACHCRLFMPMSHIDYMKWPCPLSLSLSASCRMLL